MHVLLIEPDSALAKTYVGALQHSGHSVTWVTRAQKAIHSADVDRPDVVVLELQLAAHNGVEFLHEFRSYPEWQQVPVLLLTLVSADALQLKPATLRQLGVAGHLYKPATTLQQLVAAVEGTTLER